MTKAIHLKTHGWTIDQLKRAWELTRKQVQLIRKIIYDDSFDLKGFHSVKQRYKECFNAPDRIDCQLTAINEIMNSHGIEAITVNETLFQDRYYSNSIGIYVNQGDSYILTIVYNTVDSIFEIISWGDYLESMEARLEKELDLNYN